MQTFKDFFIGWIDKKTAYQISVIDKICIDLNIDSSDWFNNKYRRNFGDYTGTDFLKEMLSSFLFFVEHNFSAILLKYLEPDGINIYKEPYICIFDYELGYQNDKLYLNKENRKNFRKKITPLTLTQKTELMQNELFSYVVNQTNLKIFSKKEIRALKLRAINEYK